MVKIDSEDNGTNDSNNETFEEVLDARMSRRGFVGGGLATAAGLDSRRRWCTAESGSRLGPWRERPRPLLGFRGIEVSTADTVVVPRGYTAEVLIAWGDPVSNGPEFEPDASNSAADQAQQWGAHNDGLVYFPIDGSRHGLLAQNNEYADEGLLFPDGIANWNEEKTNKSLNAHGVSIIEIKRALTRRSTIAAAGAAGPEGHRLARRAPVEVRAPHHRPDPDEDRRPGGGRRPVEDV